MNAIVRFPPALGAWVAQQLEGGVPADALVLALRDQGVAEEPASRIVEACVRSRAEGTPAPIDALELRPLRVLVRLQRPALAVLADVLGADDCRELIERARGRLAPSTLVDPASGRDVASGLRGSLGMFFRLREDAFIARIDERISALMGLPVAHGEGLQVLHYPPGAGSAPHFDFLVPSNDFNVASIARSGQRLATMVTYLNDVPAGGQTDFPAAGLAVTPQRGHAVVFRNCDAAGVPDPDSVHASRPVERGEKWVATKWMRERPFVSAPR